MFISALHSKPAKTIDKFFQILYLGMRMSFRMILGKERRNRFMVAKYNHPGIWGYRAMVATVFPRIFRERIERSLQTYRLQLLRVFEKEVQQAIESTSGKLFVDVGSNVGVHSINASRKFKRVISFEPYPPASAYMEEAVDLLQIKNISLRNMAIGNKEGTINLRISPNPGGHSISENAPLRQTKRVIQVALSTLTKQLQDEPQIDLVKVDVEGAELQVVQGAEAILDRILAWIIEVHSHDIEDKQYFSQYFREHGYQIKWVDINHLYAWRV